MPQTIAQAVEQIKGTVLLRNLDEASTKQGIVLKLLHLGGWNTFDLSEVAPEYTVGNRRVDFALKPSTANTVFIEAKRLGESLENHQQQLLEYSFQEGVRMAALTNGQTWWLYLPLRQGNWEQRRFLTIDLESQEPAIVEQRFIAYLSRENVISGRAIDEAETLSQSQQRVEITKKTLIEAWNHIVKTPDDILVDLLSETAERICGFKVDPELVKQFLSRVHAIHKASERSSPPVSGRDANAPSANQTLREEQGSTLPITLVPRNQEEFKANLLCNKEAWLEEWYRDGRKEVRRWDASRMRPSSSVMGNLRSRPEYRRGVWQEQGLVRVRASIERPTDALGSPKAQGGGNPRDG
ncbi:MAG: hypothetical protein OXF54_02105 [Caldilineaceae bacterium]|nr:hypothetical protein [Caldilineaceae bacterium]MCY4079009.1 hypothetical protein [Caldilineaceae bacterium]